MEDFRCASVHFHFKILDSEMFGGEGTVGYARGTMGECINLDKAMTKEGYIEDSKAYQKVFSEQLKVPMDKIILVSRDEYLANTEEDDEI